MGPEFLFVSASAGSGKTHRLTARLIRLLLDPREPYRDLHHVLAITFTNNAAREMRRRLLDWLKGAARGEASRLRYLQEAFPEAIRPPWTEADWREHARRLLEELLERYGELALQTIDSFVSKLLRATATEFGLHPGLELLLDYRPLLQQALERYLEELFSTPEAEQPLEELLELIEETSQRYLWNPQKELERALVRLYGQLTSHGELAYRFPEPGELERIRATLRALTEEMDRVLERWRALGLDLRRNFASLLEDLRAGKLEALLERSLDQPAFKNGPDVRRAEAELDPLRKRLQGLRRRYGRFLARARYAPYLRLYSRLRHALEALEREEGRLHLAAATRLLLRKLSRQEIPDIYFRLGDRIYHYLIDEFQDTSPLQWAVLYPLVEEALARGGSLFLVGDTKQAIYGFRGGDWQIMARMREREVFPSAPARIEELRYNYRSDGLILEFVRRVFEESVARHIQDEAGQNPYLERYWKASGLAAVHQCPLPGREEAGYVRYVRLSESEIEPARVGEAIVETLRAAFARGYAWGEMAVLAPRNRDVLQVAAWLAEAGIPSVSHSSLDVRSRFVTGSLLALLTFLDSPIQDRAFATVLLGPLRPPELSVQEVRRFLQRNRSRPLYVAFRERYPELWARYFERLFVRVGYLPLYDLVVEIYQTWRLLERFPEEGATWAKLLQVVRRFEESDQGSLRDFLEYAEEETEDEDWDVPVAEGLDAVSCMSVHKAKGLEFPFLLVYWPDRPPASDTQYIGPVPPERGSAAMSLWYLSESVARADPELQAARDHYRAMGVIDALCRLYVALTRARHELHCFWIDSRRPALGRFLPAASCELGRPAVRSPASEAPAEVGFPWPEARGPGTPRHPRTFDPDEVQRGEFWHAVLARIHRLEPDLQGQVLSAIERVLARRPEWARWAEEGQLQIPAFLQRADVRPFFMDRPGRLVYTELEVLGLAGELYRIDRVVCDPDQVWILDFKTGTPRPEDAAQVRLYATLLRNRWPDRPIQTRLLYVEG